ncbi:sensor histidine kinase [Williamwhitmania taraxaci]|uniref:histidine kinase n=1 Tax=Williamwhitmania taraxaci TaxID=1640674 RepID=A0A1G6NUB8_9BACT|nr:hybrid sensor histidine kinase/response regulator [Williamwhitmania taraxaci]SDC70755.1 Signal transduction histidine kinase [Williamwhitmania taraxaci]
MEVLRVLVVDDEPGIRSGIHRILSKFSVSFPFLEDDIEYDLLEASTGEEAIEIIKQNTVDIVLLDNKLPGIQGIEVLDFIKSNFPAILVVMITSYASLELAVNATNKGAYDFVPKPFTPQELKTSMEGITKHLFLKRMTKKLNKEGRQIRFQFLTLLSHELKAPLSAIEGYLHIIQERQAGDDIAAYDKMIDRSLDRIKSMRNLIMDLLDLTHIDSGKMKREVKLQDIVPIIVTSMDTVLPFAVQCDVEVVGHWDLEMMMEVDSDEMEIILNNLLSNAVKYNKPDGKVFLEVAFANEDLVITVRDTGIGIEEEDIARLFDEFMRVKSAQTKHISGSGLGLSIVKRIVKLYNGTISVDSKLGEGTTFTITLPVVDKAK